jgi:hypothetical protein
MQKLWVFGDSFSTSYPMVCPDYIKWKGYEPKMFYELLSDYLNVDYINKAEMGKDNYTIFNAICKETPNIGPEDYIIVGWSSPLRFRLLSYEKVWNTFFPHPLRKMKFKHLTDESFEELSIYRDTPLATQEIQEWMLLLQKTYGDRIVFWSPFICGIPNILYPFKNLVYGSGAVLETIYKETKGIVNDTHFSEKGNVKLSEFLITHLDKWKRYE